jgi:hypothetical protein
MDHKSIHHQNQYDSLCNNNIIQFSLKTPAVIRPTMPTVFFVKFNFTVRSFSGAHVNCEVGGGNNIFAEDAPPQPLSEVIQI